MADIRIIHGDALDVLRTLDADSIDALVTDPPAGIGFMGKDWDGDRGGSQEWIAWAASVFRECLRVLKPGAHGAVWALPRTSHWTATALELAGFEIRDRIAHVFGTGFPKSLNVGKAIDRRAGAVREVVGVNADYLRRKPNGMKTPGSTAYRYSETQQETNAEITAAATPLAQRFDGYGTALKPAVEDWWIVRRPLVGTVAENVERFGTGGINVDGARVGTDGGCAGAGAGAGARVYGDGLNGTFAPRVPGLGRWPANIVLSHSAECVRVGTKRVRTATNAGSVSKPFTLTHGEYAGDRPAFDYGDADGKETIDAYACAPGCPVAAMDGQSGETTSTAATRHNGARPVTVAKGAEAAHETTGFSDRGGASRFFHRFEPDAFPFVYQAKASRADRGAGNKHPTVKASALMRHLVRLLTPPGGVVLDPFAGSGSTLIAAMREGFEAIGIEQSAEYVEQARARVAQEQGPPVAL